MASGTVRPKKRGGSPCQEHRADCGDAWVAGSVREDYCRVYLQLEGHPPGRSFREVCPEPSEGGP